METTYYTLTAREIIVSGDGISAAVGAPARQLVCVRRPASQEEQAQDNVIDLAAWKAAREEETRLEEELSLIHIFPLSVSSSRYLLEKIAS